MLNNAEVADAPFWGAEEATEVRARRPSWWERGGSGWRLGGVLLVLGSGLTAGRAELATALQTLRTAGSSRNAEAADAWAEVARASAGELPVVLRAFAGVEPSSANYLFSAASALAEKRLAEGESLPVEALGAFLLDAGQDARARRLALDWLTRVDPAMVEALRPGLLDDPANELRREAVAALMERAAERQRAGGPAGAVVLYRQALGYARDPDQVETLTGALRELGHPVSLVEVFGFLTRWQVIGPFDNTGGAGFERVFPPETEVRLDAEYDGKEGRVRWKELVSVHERGMVDLNKAYAPLKEVTGYAMTTFLSDTARPAEIRLGSKNGWKVWWNGQYLFGRDEYHRGAEIDQYRMPVEVKAGANTLLVKLTQNEQVEDWTVEWEFQVRITDPTGRPLRSAVLRAADVASVRDGPAEIAQLAGLVP